MTGPERVFAMLDHRPVDRLPLMPITMMFAADQIGVKYGAYARDHRVLVEAQIHTARKFGFDYVSAISDPAREAADLGATIEYYEDQPPAIIEDKALLADKATLGKLDYPDPLGGGRLHDRVKAIALFKQRVGAELLIEGWVEGPCAQAADLRGINTLMLDFHDDPGFVEELMGFVIEMELRSARAQIDAGADLIGIGDAAASLVGPKIYSEFIQPRESKLVVGIRAMGARVRLHICGNTKRILAGMGRTGADIVDLDYLSPLAMARQAMGPDQVLLGNLEPVGVLRNGTPESVAAAIAACHREAGARYIVSAGCEVCRDTPVANLRALCDYAFTHQ
ncbi:MAG: uroporphyrinogen decarboxylase family protein [Bryobacterales bacterium]|nr:uroporphyrinogen decarboxylase family protein [Bryobacterales bacterium]